MTYFNNLKDIAPTQVLAKGILLNDLLKEDFLEELKSKLGEQFETLIVSDIRLMLLPKPEEPKLKKGKKGVYIQVSLADFIRLEQPSVDHIQDKVIVITSNRKGHIDLLLKK